MPTYGSLWPTYAKQWDSMSIRPSKLTEFRKIAKRLFDAKERYVRVQNKTGVPWYMIAVIHEREASQNWNTQLAQGDPLSRSSTHVPRGRGPFATWEAGALDALHIDKLDQVKDWRIEKILYYLELYNGWGYHSHGVPSAYVWAGSTIYTRGKYVADGVWSSTATDTQPGCAPLLKCLMELDPTIKVYRETVGDTPASEALPKPTIAAKAASATAVVGGAGAVVVATQTTNWLHVSEWVALAAAVVAGVYYIIHWIRGKKDVAVVEGPVDPVPAVDSNETTGAKD